jgi:anti-sigma regulatory factor (Ser/Thr protein kinase)
VAASPHLVVHRAAPAAPGYDTELRLDVPSDLALVHDAVELIAAQCAGALSRRRVAFNLRTALAEALANAMTYGNGSDPTKVVRVRVEVGGEAVRIHVADDGAGFDVAAVPDPTTPDHLWREDGRGLFVIRHLVDQLSFNDRGNVICLLLKAG